MSGMRHLPTPSAGDLSDIRFLTVLDLRAARDALVDTLAEGELEEGSIYEVFALLLDGSGKEPGR
jgi:hypothetical protein